MNRSLRFYTEKIEKNEELKRLINEKINKRNTDQKNHFQQYNDSYFIDKKTYFVEKRKNEILSLVNSDLLTHETRLRLLCEQKMLGLTEIYQKMKERVLKIPKDLSINENQNNLLENHFLDRTIYKRERPQKKYEAKTVEKFELHMKLEQENRKK